MKLFLVKTASDDYSPHYDEVISAVIYARTPEAAIDTFYRIEHATQVPVTAAQVPRAEGVVYLHFNAG